VTRPVHLREEVRSALDARAPSSGPALVFDLAAIEARMDAALAAGRRHGVRVLFAMKSFVSEVVWGRAAARLDGLDAGSANEARAAAALGARRISITDPSAGEVPSAGERWVSCEDAARAAALAGVGVNLAVRFAASHLVPGDDAVGGVLDGGGRRTSRFGVRSADEARAIVRAGGGRVRGAHVHHGGVAPASPERLVACARGAIAAAAAADLPLEWLDLGGGLHLLPDLDAAFAAIRAAVPASIELVVEPGRLFARGAGFAIGHVRAARSLGDRELRVVDLSRACHLRWQHVAPASPPAATGAARTIVFTGPTCYEEDVVGEWKLDPARFAVGAPLVVAGVDGYAVGWNHGFAGVAPAEVVFVS
jgi:diaminopimelate decarboxylase